MDKAILKQKAEDYALKQWEGQLPWSIIQKAYYDGYRDCEEEMKAQIEKMKCCENCKHSDTECEGHTICHKGHFFDCLSNKIFDHTSEEKDYWEKDYWEKDYWEIKENDSNS